MEETYNMGIDTRIDIFPSFGDIGTFLQEVRRIVEIPEKDYCQYKYECNDQDNRDCFRDGAIGFYVYRASQRFTDR